MKNLFLLSCILLAISSYAQTSVGTATGNPLHYEAIIKTDSALKKDFLFGKVIDWMSREFQNEKSVIQAQDKQNGFIIGKFSYKSLLGGSNYTRNYANIKISVKDGKIRYELYGFVNEMYGQITDGDWEDKAMFGKAMRKKIYAGMQNDSKNNSDMIIKSLTDYFSKLKQDNW